MTKKEFKKRLKQAALDAYLMGMGYDPKKKYLLVSEETDRKIETIISKLETVYNDSTLGDIPLIIDELKKGDTISPIDLKNWLGNANPEEDAIDILLSIVNGTYSVEQLRKDIAAYK